MPRQARIDIPDSLYHIIARGIERRKIFKNEFDYEDFLRRLDQGLKRTGNKCLAYSLLGNHFHLLILRGQRPLAELMRRLLTGYAVNFNLRNRRVGHLFQNRYKAILCDYDAYVLELVAYIHLNPLRAGLVESLRDLRKYRWCGHGALMGDFRASFLAHAEVLEKFGNDLEKARKNYEVFIGERVGKYKKGELSGGGLKRSQGGIGTLSVRREEEKELSDARILGDGEFVETVLNLKGKEQNQSLMSLAQIASMVRAKTGVGLDEIRSLSRVRKIVKARALYCFLAKEKGGVSGSELMKDLRLTSGAVSHLVSVGREVIRSQNN
jgi:REP element-mobilizing transposase RayT